METSFAEMGHSPGVHGGVGGTLGKATVTGYCKRFKTLKDINTDVLKAAIAFGIENTNNMTVTLAS